MEENTNLDSGQTSNAGRPTFLTVLCILTFIGSGLGVLGGLLGLVGSSALATFAPAGAGILWSVLALLAAGLCLFGAIQMWGLKKQGFMLYLAGSAISVIVSIINTVIITSATSAIGGLGGMDPEFDAIYSASAGAVNSMVWVGTFFGIAITVAFVLMYNANKKHLVH
jgi:hypothetical protein